jgi:hypothetical protein
MEADARKGQGNTQTTGLLKCRIIVVLLIVQTLLTVKACVVSTIRDNGDMMIL